MVTARWGVPPAGVKAQPGEPEDSPAAGTRALVQVRLGRTSLLLQVPADGDDSESLIATVKELKPQQKVQLTYRREGGLCWLDEISAG